MALADDIMIAFSDESNGSLLQVALDLHQTACNVRVNVHKSLVLFLPDTGFSLPFRTIHWSELFRYLGAWFSGGKVAAQHYENVLTTQLQQGIDSWHYRALSMCSCVILLNTFALSRIWFASQWRIQH
jgi:hypothetical protein